MKPVQKEIEVRNEIEVQKEIDPRFKSNILRVGCNVSMSQINKLLFLNVAQNQ